MTSVSSVVFWATLTIAGSHRIGRWVYNWKKKSTSGLGRTSVMVKSYR